MLPSWSIPDVQLVAATTSLSAGEGNPVADPLLRHLKLHSATSRITSALTVTAWLHALRQGSLPPPTPTPDLSPGAGPSPQSSSVPQDVVLALFGCLAQPAVVVTVEGVIQPYTELATVYSAMQKQAQVHNHDNLSAKVRHGLMLETAFQCLVLSTWNTIYCSLMLASLCAIAFPCITADANAPP